ncbi:hypothetical protein ACIQOW_06740 [Kitasatospora sp. NPDC091335]|uniref:hypothetical protein n=1 Tax=Kitasatospora sp. NPDC091335 TaxID=3364085 RepID=UPI0038039090
MAPQQKDQQEDCPGTGQQGRMDESAAGDEWYAICPVCGTRWMGGSVIIEPHKEWRPH